MEFVIPPLLVGSWWDTFEPQDLTFSCHMLASPLPLGGCTRILSGPLQPGSCLSTFYSVSRGLAAWKVHFPNFLASWVPCQLGSVSAGHRCEVDWNAGGREKPLFFLFDVSSCAKGLWALHWWVLGWDSSRG